MFPQERFVMDKAIKVFDKDLDVKGLATKIQVESLFNLIVFLFRITLKLILNG